MTRREWMKKAVIVYESLYGNTKRVAQAIKDGMEQVGDIECSIKKTSDIHTNDLLGYDAILFGGPNHNQGPARNILKFIDRAAIVDLNGKIGAAFDTYTGGNIGIAVAKLETIIREKLSGMKLVVDGFSALVEDRRGPLADKEIPRATEFGALVGRKLLT
ncbi:MAG: flavodoxin domain-containing protein [Candidatus Thorarchaeota archaeon]|nr:flavodoxin domain-containing protein [Candidatus Thorarchaeota archaeon]